MYGVEDKILGIIFSMMMLLQAFVIRTISGTYIVPASIFSLAWFVFTFVPLVILFNVPINSMAILYIYLCTLAFSLSALLFNWRAAFKVNALKRIDYSVELSSNFMRYCLYLFVVSSVVSTTVNIFINGYSLEDIFLNSLVTSGRFAAIRGNEGVEYGIYGILSIFGAYMSPVLGAFISYAERNVKKFLIIVLSFFPSIFAMIIQSSKLMFYIAFAIFLSSTLLMKILCNKTDLVKISVLPKFLGFILILFPFLLFSFVSRENYSDFTNMSATIDLLMYAITSYTLGQIYAFSDFFSYFMGMHSVSTYLNDYYNLGAYTFASVFGTLGMEKIFPPGLYLETGYFMDVFETNVFTMFRGLIYDFGGIGSITFMFYFGVIVHLFFNRLLLHQHSWLAFCIFNATIVFIITSYLISVFMARYMILNSLVLYFLLVVNHRIYSKRHSKLFKVNYTVK